MRHTVLAGVLGLMALGTQLAAPAEQATGSAPRPVSGPQQPSGRPSDQAIPDSPTPQTLPTLGTVAPGKGTTVDSNGSTSSPSDQAAPPTSLSSSTPTAPEDAPPEIPGTGEAPQVFARQTVNFVDVPFTVKDSKGRLVFGLNWRDVRIYENGLRQKPALFTVDPFPLSVALVIDQSMPFDTMNKVNTALSSLQAAFTPYDEVAVFTYNNGPRVQTTFTAAQSARLTQALELSKGKGREPMYYDASGPMAQDISINGGADHTDPLTTPNRGRSVSTTENVPRDVHTLNDAILEAAKSLTKTANDRRRIIYVISDGKEYGSQAKQKDVIRYLQANRIAVWATLVGDTAVPGLGFMDRFHLPLMMRDNILPIYAAATGGQTDAEYRTRGIETSFAKITEEVRTQYTLGYVTHEPFIDGKYRKIEVRVLRPNLNVIAKDGYWPTAQEARPPASTGLMAPGTPRTTPPPQ